jgi:hypothetical protein
MHFARTGNTSVSFAHSAQVTLRLALLLPLLLLPACAVLFVSPYDEVTDRAVTELVARTENFLARYTAVTDETGGVVQTGKSYDSEAAAFYDDAVGGAAAIQLRAERKEKNEEEVEILKNLGTQYRRLERSHRLGTITSSSAAGLRRTLRSLIQVQLTKKHIRTANSTTEGT